MFVYVMGFEPAGPVKIGIAGSVKNRLKQMQTSAPRQVMVFYVLDVGDLNADLVEAFAHRLLIESTVRGEWFSVSADEAQKTVDLAARMVRVGIQHIRITLPVDERPKARIRKGPSPIRTKDKPRPFAPMSIKNVPRWLRSNAMGGARSSGMVLGRWVSEAISEHAARAA